MGTDARAVRPYKGLLVRCAKSRTVCGIHIFRTFASRFSPKGARISPKEVKRTRYDLKNEGEPLAQLVEHNTFNVGAMGSNPMRLTDVSPSTL